VGGEACFQNGARCSAPQGSNRHGAEAWALHLKVGTELVPFRNDMLLDLPAQQELVFYVPEGDQLDYTKEKLPLYEDNTGSYTIRVTRLYGMPPRQPIKGAQILNRTKDSYCRKAMVGLLGDLKKLGATHAAFSLDLVHSQGSILPATNSADSFCVGKAVETAHELGLEAILRVSLSGDPADPKTAKAFRAELEKTLRTSAALASALAVDLLVFGPGMIPPGPGGAEELAQLLSALHGSFFGKLAYAATPEDLKRLEPAFFSTCCDLTALAAQWPLSTEPLPAPKDLKVAWKPYLLSIKTLSDAATSPVLLLDAPAAPAKTYCAKWPSLLGTAGDEAQGEACQTAVYTAFSDLFFRENPSLTAGHVVKDFAIPGERPSDFSPIDHKALEILDNVWHQKQ
jgi:hypothetical protein